MSDGGVVERYFLRIKNSPENRKMKEENFLIVF